MVPLLYKAVCSECSDHEPRLTSILKGPTEVNQVGCKSSLVKENKWYHCFTRQFVQKSLIMSQDSMSILTLINCTHQEYNIIDVMDQSWLIMNGITIMPVDSFTYFLTSHALYLIAVSEYTTMRQYRVPQDNSWKQKLFRNWQALN